MLCDSIDSFSGVTKANLYVERVGMAQNMEA